MIWWAGIPSDEVQVVVEKYPEQNGPEKQYETVQIPGRNGDLLLDNASYSNYEQRYEIYFNANKKKTPTGARRVRAWLLSPKGYQRLEDSYDPDYYRMAYYKGPPEIENAMNLFGRSTITFVCKPQRYRKDGQYPTTFTAAGYLYNPELFAAQPIVKVYGNGAGTVTVGGQMVTIKEIDGYVVLDSDTQNAYKDTLNKNNTISAPEFPVLQPGNNAIGFSGGVAKLEITPRWWTV